jgi:predicted small lipoprotein YifL
LTGDRLSVLRRLTVAAMVALALAACGRKGSLDPPPDTAIPVPPPTAAPRAAPTTFIDPTTPTGGAQPATVRATQANPAPPIAKKTFVLDPLIE